MHYMSRRERKRIALLSKRAARAMTRLGWCDETESVSPAESVCCALLWWLDELQEEEQRRAIEDAIQRKGG